MKAEDIGFQDDLSKPILIDTSAWILALRKGGSLRARDEIDRLIVENRAATAGIVKLELLAGTKTEEEYTELKEDLEALIQLELTPKIWESASYRAYNLRRRGITVPSTDILTMTIAAENGCNLLHADRHFDLMAKAETGLSPSTVISLLG